MLFHVLKTISHGRVQDEDMGAILPDGYHRVAVEEFLYRVQRSPSLRIVSSDLHLKDASSEGVSCIQHMKHLRDVILMHQKLN